MSAAATSGDPGDRFKITSSCGASSASSAAAQAQSDPGQAGQRSHVSWGKGHRWAILSPRSVCLNSISDFRSEPTSSEGGPPRFQWFLDHCHHSAPATPTQHPQRLVRSRGRRCGSRALVGHALSTTPSSRIREAGLQLRREEGGLPGASTGPLHRPFDLRHAHRPDHHGRHQPGRRPPRRASYPNRADSQPGATGASQASRPGASRTVRRRRHLVSASASRTVPARPTPGTWPPWPTGLGGPDVSRLEVEPPARHRDQLPAAGAMPV